MFLNGRYFYFNGVIEHKAFLNTGVFIGVYIALGVVPLLLLLINNKRYFGHYIIN